MKAELWRCLSKQTTVILSRAYCGEGPMQFAEIAWILRPANKADLRMTTPLRY
jgi:hypothetical protein